MPSEIISYDSDIYFRALKAGYGEELFKYDGTTNTMVIDAKPGSGSGMPRNLTIAGPLLYFTADNGTNGEELWYYDGTSAVMAMDIFPGSTSSEPSFLTALGSGLYFSANDGVNGTELWSSECEDIPGSGLDESSLAEISVYPNPVVDVLHITQMQAGELQIQIIDHSGKVLKTYSDNKLAFDIDLSSLNPGMYLIQLANDQNVVVERLVKQ